MSPTDTGFVTGLVMSATAVGGLLVKYGPSVWRTVIQRPERPPEPPSYMNVPAYKRSMSPSSVAAVVVEKLQEQEEERTEAHLARQSLIEQTKQTELLRQLVSGIAALPQQLNTVADDLHEDIRSTRHEIRSDAGAIHLEIAGLSGPERFRQVQGLIAQRELGSDPLAPPRRRMPSRPGGE